MQRVIQYYEFYQNSSNVFLEQEEKILFQNFQYFCSKFYFIFLSRIILLNVKNIIKTQQFPTSLNLYLKIKPPKGGVDRKFKISVNKKSMVLLSLQFKFSYLIYFWSIQTQTKKSIYFQKKKYVAQYCNVKIF
eukprot:TRINITY_DN1717_c2_g3_i1.p1 TRINITY_DN1717_c2_g3~~TRINITY_DN1717_c2_g3_i1.p1  ORF type:complete len:133 (+),score=3.06 TRINITY_DN1717_c2_g3_i1:707-1105(+)